MNIQIFGTKKCNDTKKAERFFKERGIKYQFIDMKEKGMSKGEFNSEAQANGGLENMVNWDGKDKDLLALIKYIADEDKLEKVLENPQVIKTPVYYIEAIDRRTYLYTASRVYESSEKLLSLEKLLEAAGFIRVRKNCIINKYKLRSMMISKNSHIEAVEE